MSDKVSNKAFIVGASPILGERVFTVELAVDAAVDALLGRSAFLQYASVLNIFKEATADIEYFLSRKQTAQVYYAVALVHLADEVDGRIGG